MISIYNTYKMTKSKPLIVYVTFLGLNSLFSVFLNYIQSEKKRKA